MRARLGAQPGGRTEATCHGEAEARHRRVRCPRRRDYVTAAFHGVRRAAAGGRLRSARTTAWWRWATSRRSRPGRLVPLSGGRLEPADAKAAARSGTPMPIWAAGAGRPPTSAGCARAAAAATGAEYLDLTAPSMAISSATAAHADRRRRPLAPHRRVVPPPRVPPRLDPRIPAPERLWPAGDRSLPGLLCDSPTRRLRLRRHLRRVARRHPPGGVVPMSASIVAAPSPQR